MTIGPKSATGASGRKFWLLNDTPREAPSGDLLEVMRLLLKLSQVKQDERYDFGIDYAALNTSQQAILQSMAVFDNRFDFYPLADENLMVFTADRVAFALRRTMPMKLGQVAGKQNISISSLVGLGILADTTSKAIQEKRERFFLHKDLFDLTSDDMSGFMKMDKRIGAMSYYEVLVIMALCAATHRFADVSLWASARALPT